MSTEDSGGTLGTAWSVLRDRPDEILPAFLAETALGIVGQSVFVVVVLFSYLSLRGSGRIERVRVAVERIAEEGITEANAEALVRALEGLFTPTVVATILAGVVVAAVVLVLARAIVGAAKVGTAHGAMDGRESPLATGVAAVRRHGRTFVRFVLLQVLVFLGLPILGVVLALVGGDAGLALFGLLLLLEIPVAIVGYFVLLFTPEAIVVEDVGVRTAVAHSRDFLLDNVGTALLYLGLEVGVLILTGIISNVTGVLGVPQLLTVLSTVLFVPWLGLVKMGLYLDRPSPRAVDRPAPGTRLRAALARGTAEASAFTRRHVGLVGVALATFLLGVAGGWALVDTAGIPPLFDRGAAGADFGPFPAGVAVNIALNNWIVAISQTYAGFVLGVPTLINLAFNGAIVGGLAALGVDPVVFAALILPHGIIEVPALVVSGALGLHLAGRGLAFYRGDHSVEAFAGDLRAAFYVLVGLFVAFAAAGLVEAFLTPVIGDAVRSAVVG